MSVASFLWTIVVVAHGSQSVLSVCHIHWSSIHLPIPWWETCFHSVAERKHLVFCLYSELLLYLFQTLLYQISWGIVLFLWLPHFQFDCLSRCVTNLQVAAEIYLLLSWFCSCLMWLVLYCRLNNRFLPFCVAIYYLDPDLLICLKWSQSYLIYSWLSAYLGSLLIASVSHVLFLHWAAVRYGHEKKPCLPHKILGWAASSIWEGHRDSWTFPGRDPFLSVFLLPSVS